jgi:hypothetical protein
MNQKWLTAAAGFTSKSCSHLVARSGDHNGFYVRFFFSSRSMRTLFLTDNKVKHWPWRIMLMCGLVAVLMVGVYFAIGDSIGEGESAVVLLCVALFGGVVALVYRRVQVRRLQCTVRDLKDSALW